MSDSPLSGARQTRLAAHHSPAAQPNGALQGQSSASLSARPGGVVVLPGRGLRLPRQLPFERWLQVGRQLADIYTSSAWCLGDWLVYGEAAYDGRYREAIERTSLDYQTLRNYAWVAKRFSLSRRRENLSFGHHAEVAALQGAEQDFWLRKAEELGWSVKHLRREVRSSLSERSARDDSRPSHASEENHSDKPIQAEHSVVSLAIHVTQEQLENCRTAANAADLTLEEWAVVILDQEACRERRTASRSLTLARQPAAADRTLAWPPRHSARSSSSTCWE